MSGAPPPESYQELARALVDTGIISDPWLDGAPRFDAAPVVLSAKEHRALARAGEELALAIDEAVRLVHDDEALLADFIALTPSQRAMFASSAPAWHGIARADVFVTTDGGLQITELNSDTPTGEPEAVVLGALARAARPELIDPCAQLPSRFHALCELLWRRVAGADASSTPKTVGIVYPTELTEDLSLIRLWRLLFEQRGWSVVLGSPYNLDRDDAGALSLFGAPIGLMVRHYKTDWWGERQSAWLDDDVEDAQPLAEPLAAALGAAMDGKVAVVNPFAALVAQNKRLLALLWERIHRFSPATQGIVQRIIPYTARLEALHDEQLRADKDAWVLKSDWGAEGDEVVVGKLVDQTEWERALALARPGRFVAQRWFAAARVDGKVRNHGVFVVGGEACGVYTRLDGGHTDPAALSVPTLVSP